MKELGLLAGRNEDESLKQWFREVDLAREWYSQRSAEELQLLRPT